MEVEMAGDDHAFVAWEEHILCHERGRRVVHYFLKESSGDLVLAVVGTERSIRHMMYVVSDDFLGMYGSEGAVNGSTKWRARREVVEWLTSLVSGQNSASLSNAPSNNCPISSGWSARQNFLPDHMGSKKLKVQSSEIEWSGEAWMCSKQLKHYPAFCRDEVTITVHSFVLVIALDDQENLGYLEDLYEDKKGQKRVKVRWFYHGQEMKDEFPQLNPLPNEILITPHVQVISAECVTGPATVLSPKHYDICVAQNLTSGIHLCFRQFKNRKVKPFTLAKLRGYANQAILTSLDADFVSKQRGKRDYEGNNNSVRVSYKRHRSSGMETTKPGSVYPKLKFTLGSKARDRENRDSVFKVGKMIEVLCQDSGVRGCWFQCKIVGMSQKFVKVSYDDVEDADGLGNLEELIPAYKVAASDKLGMRCSGRPTVRPRPPNDSTAFNIEIGTPIDVWWSDGWWEGVVTGIEASEAGLVQVYFPGEERCLNIQRKMIRASRDWVGSRWVDVKTKPDILLHLPEHVIARKLSPAIKEISRSEIVDEDAQGLLDLATSVHRLKIGEAILGYGS